MQRRRPIDARAPVCFVASTRAAPSHVVPCVKQRPAARWMPVTDTPPPLPPAAAAGTSCWAACLRPDHATGTHHHMPRRTPSPTCFCTSSCVRVAQDAVRGDHGDIATLVIQRGGKVLDKDGHLVELADSPLAGNVRIFTDYDPEWEIDPATIKLQDKIGGWDWWGRARAHRQGHAPLAWKEAALPHPIPPASQTAVTCGITRGWLQRTQQMCDTHITHFSSKGGGMICAWTTDTTRA